MVKDSRRFADSGGWGYAVFDDNPKSDTFTPGTAAGSPPQGNDAKVEIGKLRRGRGNGISAGDEAAGRRILPGATPIRGPAVAHLSLAFSENWERSGGAAIERSSFRAVETRDEPKVRVMAFGPSEADLSQTKRLTGSPPWALRSCGYALSL